MSIQFGVQTRYDKSHHGHVVFHHGALFELMLDGVCMDWTGRFKKLPKVIVRLSCLVLEITLCGHNVLLVGAV
jgi:hypothetical protein